MKKKIAAIFVFLVSVIAEFFITKGLDTISINMAKNQNIALNPNKINGSCGRLLCCLAYEDEIYSECRKYIPQVGSTVKYKGKEYKVISNDLLAGKETKLPTFNFVTGCKEFNNPPIKIDEKTIILMEGLHCLNDDMVPDVDPSTKYKVYLSPFIPLNIDKHNYISTVDLRLLRRIVRDNRTRARDVGKTIEEWNNVRSGEKKYIYPFINNIDYILNTSLVYEIGVLKVFVEPLLYSVKSDSPSYNEARRLIGNLKIFFPIPSDYVNEDSILREFIGKSAFNSI